MGSRNNRKIKKARGKDEEIVRIVEEIKKVEVKLIRRGTIEDRKKLVLRK